MGDAAISRIDIQRSAGQLRITLHTAKPGIVIGARADNMSKNCAANWGNLTGRAHQR